MDLVIWNSIEGVFSMMSVTFAYLFLHAFFKTTPKNKYFRPLKLVTLLLSSLVTFAVTYFTQDAVIISTISVLSSFTISTICFRAKPISAILGSIFVFLAGAASELFSVFIVTNFQGIETQQLLEPNVYRLQSRALSFILLLLLIAVVRYFRAGRLSGMNVKSLLTLCVLPVLSALFMQGFARQILTTSGMPNLNDFLPVFSLVAMNVFLFVLIENLIRQNEKNKHLVLIEVQNRMYYSRITSLTHTQEQIQKMSHDFKQKIQLIYMMADNEEYEQLKDYVTTLAERQEKLLLIDTGNIMFDSVLSSKIEAIKRYKIDLARKLDVEKELKYLDEELCILLGNALDNAIEACLRSSTDKFIGLELTATNNSFQLHIQNSVGSYPSREGRILKTLKGNSLKHGIGLRSMMQTCDDLGGQLLYDFDEKHFNLWVYITF